MLNVSLIWTAIIGDMLVSLFLFDICYISCRVTKLLLYGESNKFQIEIEFP